MPEAIFCSLPDKQTCGVGYVTVAVDSVIMEMI